MTFLSYKSLQLNVVLRFLPSTDFLKQNKGKLEPDGSTSNSTSSRSRYRCPLIKIVSKVLAHLGAQHKINSGSMGIGPNIGTFGRLQTITVVNCKR